MKMPINSAFDCINSHIYGTERKKYEICISEIEMDEKARKRNNEK